MDSTQHEIDGGNGEVTSPALEEGQAEGNALRREGQLAGVLFIVAPLVSLPSSLLIEPAPPALIYLLAVLGLLTGLVCLALPWERLGRGWLQLAGAIATVEVTAAATIADRSYVLFYVFIAVYAAYIARRRAELAAQLGLIALGLLAPLVYDPGSARETLQTALVALPSLAISAGMVMYLREQLEADRGAYRSFAIEALTLSSRIRGKPQPLAEPDSRPAVPTLAAALTRRRAFAPRRLALGAASFLVSLPLLSVGLAAAGVSLPGMARAPFEELGVTLPNQVDGAETAIEASSERLEPAAGGQESTAAGGGSGGENAAGEGGGKNDRGRGSADGAPGEELSTEGGTAPTTSETAAGTGTGSATGGGAVPPAPTPGSPGGGLRDTIDDTLRDTLGPVGDLLRGLRQNQQ